MSQVRSLLLKTHGAGRAALLLLAIGATSGCSKPDAGSDGAPRLFFANWEGEIGATTLSDFKRDSGIRVEVETMTENVILETKLLTGHSGSDVAVPTSSFLAPLISSGALSVLDKAKLPNWHHLDPAVLKRLESVDPGNRHAVPYPRDLESSFLLHLSVHLCLSLLLFRKCGTCGRKHDPALSFHLHDHEFHCAVLALAMIRSSLDAGTIAPALRPSNFAPSFCGAGHSSRRGPRAAPHSKSPRPGIAVVMV